MLIAGTGSGVGKTTIALALMAALRSRGVKVQPFKCGPDFIDGGHHSAVCGRASRYLDTCMIGDKENRHIFLRASADADIALVEGMMGVFDGVAGAGEEGSSAEIAKLLGLPVVLVEAQAAGVPCLVSDAVTRDADIATGLLRFTGLQSGAAAWAVSPAASRTAPVRTEPASVRWLRLEWRVIKVRSSLTGGWRR